MHHVSLYLSFDQHSLICLRAYPDIHWCMWAWPLIKSTYGYSPGVVVQLMLICWLGLVALVSLRFCNPRTQALPAIANIDMWAWSHVYISLASVFGFSCDGSPLNF